MFDENDNRNNDDHSFLRYKFTENGSFDVTVRTETPECPMGTSYTETIVIDQVVDEEVIDVDVVVIDRGEEEIMDPCDTLVFESRVFVDGGVFGDFEASDIEIFEVRFYDWLVDGELVASNNKESNDNFNFLRYEFTENGSFEVTVRTESPECPSVVYTETIVIDQF